VADTVVGDIYSNFEQALNGFYEGAAMGISGYVIPIAWVLLGICMLIWCYLMMEGKVASPVSDWLLKFIGFMVVLYIMGNGYLSWVARPIFELPSELTTAMSRTSANSPDLLGQVNEKMTNLVAALFTAGTKLLSDLAIGPAVAMFLMGAMTAAAAYLMLAWALFCIVYAKLGLSMILALGPFFILALVLPQTRSYFYTWLNTALYFVFVHVLTALFIFMFIGIVNSYVNKLNSELGASGSSGVVGMVSNLIGVGGAGLNVVALCLPLILLSLTMFFLFLQIPFIASSLTGGSGGSFGAGLTSAVHFRSMLGRIRSK
jgi:type IV secretion system protein VirB6